MKNVIRSVIGVMAAIAIFLMLMAFVFSTMGSTLSKILNLV